MKKHKQRYTCLILMICMLVGTEAIASSQDTAVPYGQEKDPGFSLSASYIHQFQTDFDRSGEFRLHRVLFRADGKKNVSETVTFGVGASYDYSDYSFSDTDLHLSTDPWDEVHTLNVAFSLLFNLDRKWKVFVAPSVGIAAESGADWGNSLAAGGIAWTSYRFSPSLTLGLGAGVFAKPEEVSAFPLIIIDWKITDRLRLGTPLQAGPTSPAGLELSYAFNTATIAAGGAYRSARFRLDDHGPIPGGVGEDTSFPLWTRLSAKIGKAGTLSFFGGAMVGGRMLVEDSRGHELGDDDYDASPFLAASISFKF